MDIKKLCEVGLKAQKDFLKYGETKLLCPFCKTKLTKEGTNVSYAIKCKTKNCFYYTVRGL